MKNKRQLRKEALARREYELSQWENAASLGCVIDNRYVRGQLQGSTFTDKSVREFVARKVRIAKKDIENLNHILE